MQIPFSITQFKCNKLEILILLLVSTMYLSGCTGSSGKAQAASDTLPAPGQNNSAILPPMPDPQVNKATIAGVDSNKDGIRDDVEIWIAQKWTPGAPKYFAARQIARSTQREITEVDKINDSNKNDYMALVAKEVACMAKTVPDNVENQNMFNDSMRIILNTSSRIIADQEVNHRMSGAVSIGFQGAGDPCEGK